MFRSKRERASGQGREIAALIYRAVPAELLDRAGVPYPLTKVPNASHRFEPGFPNGSPEASQGPSH
jgi:hypothetical protein